VDVMAFVDGTNLVARLAAHTKTGLNTDSDVDKLRVAAKLVGHWLRGTLAMNIGWRWYWFSSYSKNDGPWLASVLEMLREEGFDGNLVHRKDKDKEKGVDIALSVEMLSHAFRANYRTGILVSSDSDFVPMIEEVKRTGVQVWNVALTKDSAPAALRQSVDRFHTILDGNTSYDPELQRLVDLLKTKGPAEGPKPSRARA
jgi:uncharacterized LabA/DUF88 family protein